MPNTLTTIFTSTPSTEPVESPHPNTGVYTTGSQLGNGTWQVVHTLVTKTSTPPTVTGRLKNFPAVAASVVASGNVLNNVLTTPTGLSAVASGASAINITVSSNPNATAYRLFSAPAAGGTYSQIYQGAAASFAHTGLTAGTTYYYDCQYVGGGFYDDSLLSATFSGITAAVGVGGVQANDAAIIFINGQSNAQGNAEATEAQYAPMDTFSPNVTQVFSTVNILNVTNNVFQAMQVGVNTRSDAANTYPQGYTFGAKADGTWDVGNQNNRYNITGVGPEYGLADAWKSLGSSVPIYIIKFCEGGTSINRWLKSANDLYPTLLAHKQAAFASLSGAGKNVRVLGFLRNQGEADATMLASDYQTKLTQFYADLTADGFITNETKIIELGTPTTNDTGTPVVYTAETTAKQNFVAAGANRYFLDANTAPGVALEHDEIHWNLASQYWTGYVRVANILFGTAIALPATVQPVAPTIAFNSSTSLVTVTPPSAAWPQKEFYYIINGSSPKRLTTSFTFAIPGGVTAQSGGVQVFSRAVPGRAKSGVALNTATWVGGTTSNAIVWATPSGRYTSTTGPTSNTLYRSGGANAWDAFAPATLKIMAPAAGFTGLVASISVPNIPTVNSAVVLGVSPTPTVATKNNLLAGIYADNSTYGLAAPNNSNPDFVLAPTTAMGSGTGALTLNIYTDRIALSNSGGVVSTLTGNPFANTTVLYVIGLTYGFTGWASGQQASQIVGATLTGSTLVDTGFAAGTPTPQMGGTPTPTPTPTPQVVTLAMPAGYTRLSAYVPESGGANSVGGLPALYTAAGHAAPALVANQANGKALWQFNGATPSAFIASIPVGTNPVDLVLATVVNLQSLNQAMLLSVNSNGVTDVFWSLRQGSVMHIQDKATDATLPQNQLIAVVYYVVAGLGGFIRFGGTSYPMRAGAVNGDGTFTSLPQSLSEFVFGDYHGLGWGVTGFMGALEIGSGDITHAVATNIEAAFKSYYGLA